MRAYTFGRHARAAACPQPSARPAAARAPTQKLLPAGVDAPSSFETIGHLIHLNLREEQLPYKHLIGKVRRRGGSCTRAAAAAPRP